MTSHQCVDSSWPTGLSRHLALLQKEEELCDVMVSTNDQHRMMAHACVLACGSSILRTMLGKQEQLRLGSGSCVQIHIDMPSSVVKLLLQYLYTGNVEVDNESLVGLTQCATELNVESLTTACLQSLGDECNAQLASLADDAIPEEDVLHAADDDQSESDSDVMDTSTDQGQTDRTPAIMATPFSPMGGHSEKLTPTNTKPTDNNDNISANNNIGNDLTDEDLYELPDVTNIDTPIKLSDEIVIKMEPYDDIHLPINIVPVPKRKRGRPRKNRTVEPQAVKPTARKGKASAATEQVEVKREGDEPEKYPCIVCQEIFPDVQLRKDHEKTHKNSNPVILVDDYKCETCEKTFRLRCQLRRHMRSHTGERPHKCRKCDAAFLRKSHLDRHVRRHDPDLATRYTCQYCAKSFSTKQNLISHERLHTGDRPFPCSECSKRFTNAASLKQHHFNWHSPDHYRRHKCPVCDKGFFKVKQLKTHMVTHSDERPFKCGDCDKAFKLECSLVVHKRTHSGFRPHICDICSKAFTQRANLVAHIRVHTGEKPYVCHLCAATFAKLSGLNRHLFSHTGKKPHKCEECDKAFARLPSLISHQMIHTGLKPLACEFCGKLFRQRSVLAYHRRSMHLHLKPYKCSRCDNCYTKNENKKKHERKIHGILSSPVVLTETRVYSDVEFGDD